MCSHVPNVGAGKIAGGVSLLYDVEADVVHSADRAIDDAPRTANAFGNGVANRSGRCQSGRLRGWWWHICDEQHGGGRRR